ncbi:hypothetical protein MASR2M8_10300 [Opitutaceae bacterium]
MTRGKGTRFDREEGFGSTGFDAWAEQLNFGPVPIRLLTPSEITTALASLPGWTIDDEALTCTFAFSDFREAFAFMMRVSFEVEDLNHHPEWTNCYNRVHFRLCTHDSGHRVTRKDVKLAQRIQRLAGRT